MEHIERFFTTENEHWNTHALKVYTDAKKEGIFDDLEVPLQYFEDYSAIYPSNQEAPIRVTEQLRAAMEEDGLNTGQQEFIVKALIHWFRKTEFGEVGKTYHMNKVVTILELEFPATKYDVAAIVPGFNFEKLKKELEAIPDTANKIKHLLEQEAIYKQQDDLLISWGGNDFGKKCRVEIKKLEKILEMETKSTASNVQWSNIHLSKKQGVKTNLMRVLDALWELRFFTDEQEQYITRGEVMEAFGQFLNEDLSSFESLLSNSYNNTKTETNLAIFDEMKAKIQQKCIPK